MPEFYTWIYRVAYLYNILENAEQDLVLVRPEY